MDLLCQAKELISGIRDGSMSSIAYDTSWFLRLKDRHGGIRFPPAYEWIRNRQHPDGSWGGHFETYHDRLISTLSAVIALCRLEREENDPLIGKGLGYLRSNACKLANDEYETIGFELLLPALLDEAGELGLSLPYDQFAPVRELAKVKLARIPHGWMYEKESPLVHSLEFMGKRVEPDKLKQLLSANGSIGNSPAASAYAAQFIVHPDLESYLERVMEHSPDGGASNVEPFELFEIAWSHFNLLLAGIRLEEMDKGIEYLLQCWRPNGVGISKVGLMPDADDSALAMKAIGMSGRSVDMGFLDYYRSDKGFLTFPYERNPSVSTNIHVLVALNESVSSADLEHRRHILEFLYAARIDNRYWKDKWHMSPYYATSHAVLAVRQLDPRLTDGALQWILETQREDGSWGVFQGTQEETAYCVQALAAGGDDRSVSRHTALQRGLAYLEQNRFAAYYPELWIGKGAYAPTKVIESAILSAQVLGKKALAHRNARRHAIS